MNPKNSIVSTTMITKSWKLPLGEFIDKIYRKRFGKSAPDTVRTIEEMAATVMKS